MYESIAYRGPSWKAVVVLLLVGFALGIGLSYLKYDPQVAVLKERGALAEAHALEVDAAAKARSDSVALVVAKMAAEKAASKTRATESEARADAANAALAGAETAADSVPILATEVAALRDANKGLTHALTLAEAQVVAQAARADAAERDVHDLAGQISNLNAKIQGLRKPPSVVLKALRMASYVGTFVAGVQAGRSL